MRFLFKWQHVDPADRLRGLDGLREVLGVLDGSELGAAAWERAVLPARVDDYDPAMLDMLCLTGEIGWARLSLPPADASEAPRLRPSTPVALFLRDHADAWRALGPAHELPASASDGARRVLDTLTAKGASFFADLRRAADLDEAAACGAIGTLVASGMAASDGFSGLRALMAGLDAPQALVNRRASLAGRWTAIAAGAAIDPASAVDTQARALLRRYGVMCRRLAAREAHAAPWRDLVRAYRRFEARGEIRGGRFVSGMSGEQFALPRAVERLREVRRTPPDGRVFAIATADPLNLAGLITAGERLRASSRHRVAYRDGVPVAVREGDVTRPLARIDPSWSPSVTQALVRRRRSTALI